MRKVEIRFEDLRKEHLRLEDALHYLGTMIEQAEKEYANEQEDMGKKHCEYCGAEITGEYQVLLGPRKIYSFCHTVCYRKFKDDMQMHFKADSEATYYSNSNLD